MGWATTIPAFQRLGLRLEFSEDFDGLIPRYKGEVGIEAAEKLFGITEDAAEYLFGGNYHAATPQQVADNIDKVIKAKGDIPAEYQW